METIPIPASPAFAIPMNSAATPTKTHSQKLTRKHLPPNRTVPNS
jgi:hypothetical protein